jgi:hypothetical protein
MKNTNQQDTNDPHKDTKLAKTMNEHRAETIMRGHYPLGPDFVHWNRTLSARRSLEMCFPPKIHPFLPKFDSCHTRFLCQNQVFNCSTHTAKSVHG